MAGGSSHETLLLDYATETPKRGADNILPRWYGTMTKLADGRIAMTAGIKFGFSAASTVSLTPEVYSMDTGKWELLQGATSEEMFGTGAGGRWWYPHQWLSPSGSVFGISIDKVSLR